MLLDNEAAGEKLINLYGSAPWDERISNYIPVFRNFLIYTDLRCGLPKKLL